MSKSRKIRAVHTACMWGRRYAYKTSVKKIAWETSGVFGGGGCFKRDISEPKLWGVNLFVQTSQVMAPLNAVINSWFPWISWLTEWNCLNPCSWKCVFNCFHRVISVQIITYKLATDFLVYCFVIRSVVWLLSALQNGKTRELKMSVRGNVTKCRASIVQYLLSKLPTTVYSCCQ